MQHSYWYHSILISLIKFVFIIALLWLVNSCGWFEYQEDAKKRALMREVGLLEYVIQIIGLQYILFYVVFFLNE